MKIRHPEKIKNPINPIKRKPDWIKSKLVNSKEFFTTKRLINKSKLVTVCEEANCPNITECWSKKHATFMIMGDTVQELAHFVMLSLENLNLLIHLSLTKYLLL